ncbi:hypothetical protein MPTK1_5g09190 [Marchantia polymorpha subsp. ruderalis]|uniref:Uncharacterized protein n=2 Tax=Marchantia polymorpha TaxID=3197 RepID=A0AAF6BGI2_MARPO|nr:hypothetical protein MARPO_0095s0040 [Marchantia polymorpha]BBN11116.1 hypothetical protein Mp_5g09190 [Marchantia polymorpha subsp. ruderalis]|eukprot:PTQ32781.1 hypothetical protein MARPO_0095s0040 [Marchantia polymorpha]
MCGSLELGPMQGSHEMVKGMRDPLTRGSPGDRSALEGLTRLATASKENRGRKLGQRKVSFNEEGQNKLSFRRSLLAEERPTGAQARRSPMEYVGKVPRNSPAELSPMGSCQVSPRLASPGGLQTTSPASAPFPVHQGQAFNPAIPMIATPFVSGLPTLYQRSSIPVGNGGSMKPMRLDYQGYPIPAYKAVLPGISSQYLDYRGCTGAPCLEFHQLHAACFGKFAGCPVAHLVDQQVFGVDPSAQSRVRPEAYFPNYRGYPSLSYQCYQGYSAAPGMTQSGTPCFQAPLAASSTKPQAYLAPSQRTFQALPETSSTRNRGVTGASSTTKQVQLPAVPPSYIDDPTFASSNRRSSIHSRKKGHEDLSAPDSRNPKNQNPPPRPNKDYYPNLSCKTGIQLGGKRLVKRPLEAQDSRATATSPDDTLNVKVKTPPSLVETDANNVEVTSRGPGGGHICTPPPSHSELEQKSASQFHPIPGDVVILFSGLLASADREATFVYFHPNQSASEPEPRKGNMAVTGENDQRAMLIRYGEFDRNGIWTPNIQIKLFYTGSDDIWRLVTKTFVTNLPWLHRSKRSCARLRMPDPHFKPRSGDLIVRTAMPRSAARELEEAQDHQAGDAEWVLIWWDHNHLVITDDMIVRAYVGPAPKRNNQPSYSLLGRVEMYTKKDVNYLFMGRDQHTFSESTLNRRRCSSQRLCGMLHTQFCCS